LRPGRRALMLGGIGRNPIIANPKSAKQTASIA
jgi:hypothetical protein